MRNGTQPGRPHVRFGSKADSCSAATHVRFTPNSDRESGLSQKSTSALPPKADMCGAHTHVCFGPIADSCNAANGHYSINSSAIVRKFGGIVRPSALAVARLMTRRCFERHYFIVTLASAKAAGTF